MATEVFQEELLYFNGVNGATGEYGIHPMTDKEFAGLIEGAKPDVGSVNYRPMYGIDAKNLAETGWGLILPADKDDPEQQRKNSAVKEALNELIQWRQAQSGQYFKVFEGAAGYRKGETKLEFLRMRAGAGAGPVDPSKGVPYYVLIVGSPENIPYAFQHELDVQYAVGRIDFGDDLEAYQRYAASVVQAEKSGLKLRRKLTFFGVENPDDKATSLSAQYLIQPLYEKLKSQQTWTVDAILKEQAQRSQLENLLGGEQMPAILFTASHGMEFPKGDSRQLPHQGALLCSDWPGPRNWREPIPDKFYFAGEHLSADRNLLGMLAFFFACYGAGTPLYDEFSKQAFKDRETIATRSFVAALPTQMLTQPKGGALAVIGHVERAWGYSFAWPGGRAHTVAFEETLKKLLDGYPIGSAVEVFNERAAELAESVAGSLEQHELDPNSVNEKELAGLWTAHNDSRDYVVLGDPAVRLQVADAGAPGVAERPTITLAADLKAKVTSALNAAHPPVPALSPVAETTTSAASFDTTSFSFAVQEERSSLTDSIKKFTSELADSLKRAADDISSLEVITYSTDDLNKVTYNYGDKRLQGELTMRALTRIAFDGDVQVCVPQKEGHVDQEVWDVHLSMVKAAQENRAAFLATMAELATKLIGLLGSK